MSLVMMNYRPSPMRRFLKWMIPSRLLLHRGRRDEKRVALTFDDGPIPNQTEAILDLLKKENVKATFFVVGKAAEAHPELIQRIVLEGHQIGNHSYSHLRFGGSGYRAIGEEVGKTQRIIQTITGKSPEVLRSPFGQTTLSILWYSLIHRFLLISWSLDTGDSVANSVDKVLERIQSRPIRPGEIILCHDDSQFILEILPKIIAAVRGEGLAFRTINEL